MANGGVIDANLVEGPSQTRAGTDVAAEQVANKVKDDEYGKKPKSTTKKGLDIDDEDEKNKLEKGVRTPDQVVERGPGRQGNSGGVPVSA